MSRKILVTSALPNANGPIHLGHMLEHIQTDIWVRFQRMRGNEVYYVCADDTHGTATMIRAEEEGVTPEALIEGDTLKLGFALPVGSYATVLLEELLEMGISEADYDAWLINIGDGDQFGSGFVDINPNSKIPALVDHSGPQPIRVFESGAILWYLAAMRRY